MTFTPSALRPWRDAWPPVAQAGDGNAWATGTCWLYCRREGVAVLWVGSVRTPGATGDAYACGVCLAELDRMVRVQAHARDRVTGHPPHLAPRAPHSPTPPTQPCEHRHTEQRAGKTHCRHCARQLYL